MKKLIAGLLCLAMIFSLCACGKDEKKAEITLEADIETPFYSKEQINCPDPESSFEAAVGAGDSVIVCELDSKGERRLFRMYTESRSFTPIECSVPASLETLDGLSDGRAALSYRDENGALVVCEIGANNSAATNTLKLPEELEGAFIFDLKAVENGYLFTAYAGSIPCLYTVDKQGAPVSRSAFERYKELFIMRGRDDSLTAICRNGEETLFRLLDDELSVSAEYSVKTQFNSFISGGGSGEIIGVLPLGKACIMQLETGEMRGYANLADGKISRRGVVPLSDTELFCIDDGKAAIWTVSDTPERITLKLNTNSFGFSSNMELLKDAVNGFNSSSGKYYIELVDYGAYGEQAEKMLLTDIVAGKTPDIYDMKSLNPEKCYANGLAADLKPYFDADSDIDFEDIIPTVRRLTQRDGAVYELIPHFTIRAMFAPADIVGDEKFTVDSLAALAEEYGAEHLFGQSKTGLQLLENAMRYSNDFIDERSGQCSFDSPDFIKLLEIARALPKEVTTDNGGDVYYGEALLLHTWVDGFAGVGGLAQVDAVYQGDWRCVGFPTEKGTGITLSPSLRLGMAFDSQNKDGVWEFFKYLLSSSYQWNFQHEMPVIADILEQHMDGQIQMGTTGSLGLFKPDGNGGFSPDSLKIEPPTDKLKAQMLELIDSVDGTNDLASAVDDIVMNEAARFFAGDCTAEQAAANIQSRASIYLSEQYG